MRKVTLFAVLVALLSFISFGCQSQNNIAEENVAEKQIGKVDRETEESTQEAKQAVVESKTEFKQVIETKLNDLERGIDQLVAKAADATKESRDEFNKMINELNEKKAEANAKLEQLESASADAWKATKSGVTEAVDDLQNTYNRAASRFQ